MCFQKKKKRGKKEETLISNFTVMKKRLSAGILRVTFSYAVVAVMSLRFHEKMNPLITLNNNIFLHILTG